LVNDKHIASDDDLLNWAINDYADKTGKKNVSAEITSKSNDVYEITLKDKDGNTVDIYTIDPVTGSGSNSANEDVDLPQTGNNAMKNWMILLGAFILIMCGWFSVRSSGFIRRKESEDKTGI
jgi:LPXTG-motif cell wall-anchored protein